MLYDIVWKIDNGGEVKSLRKEKKYFHIFKITVRQQERTRDFESFVRKYTSGTYLYFCLLFDK